MKKIEPGKDYMIYCGAFNPQPRRATVLETNVREPGYYTEIATARIRFRDDGSVTLVRPADVLRPVEDI